MVDIVLNEGQSGYDAVGEYIQKYWEHNIWDNVIVSLGTSYDGCTYDFLKEVAYPYDHPSGFDDIEFLTDWWEGEKYIKLFGIKAVSELDISGGIYSENDKQEE